MTRLSDMSLWLANGESHSICDDRHMIHVIRVVPCEFGDFKAISTDDIRNRHTSQSETHIRETHIRETAHLTAGEHHQFVFYKTIHRNHKPFDWKRLSVFCATVSQHAAEVLDYCSEIVLTERFSAKRLLGENSSLRTTHWRVSLKSHRKQPSVSWTKNVFTTGCYKSTKGPHWGLLT